MTNVEGSPTHIRKGLLSSYRTIFVVVSITIIGVLVETGIIRVSGFVGVRDLGHEITIFVVLGILCIFSQLMILNFVLYKSAYLSFLIIHERVSSSDIISDFYLLLTILILLEVSLTFSYHTNLIRAIIMGSFLTASVLTALLSWRFIGWIKSNKNRLMLVYLLASLFISASAIVGVVYFLDQLFYRPDVI